MKKICVVTGTRAEYGLLKHLMRGIQNSKKLELQIIVTGMHLSKKFGYTINEILDETGEIKENTKQIDLNFDLPAWIKSTDNILDKKFFKSSTYIIENDIKKISYLKNEIKSIYSNYSSQNNSERAFGRFLMQYIGRGVDIFEKNFKKIN